MLATRPDSPGHLLWLVRTGRAGTRGELQQQTGLSRSTVVQRLDLLLAASLIRVAGAAVSTGGRPAQRLEFNPDHGVLLVAQIDDGGVRTAVVDVGGRLQAEEWAQASSEREARAISPSLSQSFDHLLSASGWKPDRVRGLAIAATTTTQPSGDLASALRENWGCPVLVETTASVLALGEHTTVGAANHTLLLVHLGATVDAGLVVGGTIYRGSGRRPAGIAHLPVPTLATVRCGCGQYGCLVAALGTGPLTRRLAAAGLPPANGRQLADRIRCGHPDAEWIARCAGRVLGEAIAPALRLLDPDCVVVTGGIVGEPLLAGLSEALRQARSVPRTLRAGQATTSVLAAGAHRLLVEEAYAPPAIDAMMTRFAQSPALLE